MHRASILAFAAALLTAGAASAQIDDLGGTIVHVDAAAQTVTFSDGRIAHYDPLWRIIVNGREVAVTEVQPGTVIAMAPAGTTTRGIVPGSPQAAMAPATPGTTVVAPGGRNVVASVDAGARTMTLEDGRILSVPDAQVWRRESLDTLRPGTEVFVAGPVVERPAGAVSTAPPAWTSTEREVHGRVHRMDSAGSQIILRDGRAIVVTPSTTVRTLDAKTVAVNELRPGDEVRIQVQQLVPVAGVRSESPSAAPQDVMTGPSYRYPGSALVAPDRVTIIRYNQSP